MQRRRDALRTRRLSAASGGTSSGASALPSCRQADCTVCSRIPAPRARAGCWAAGVPRRRPHLGAQPDAGLGQALLGNREGGGPDLLLQAGQDLCHALLGQVELVVLPAALLVLQVVQQRGQADLHVRLKVGALQCARSSARGCPRLPGTPQLLGCCAGAAAPAWRSAPTGTCPCSLRRAC